MGKLTIRGQKKEVQDDDHPLSDSHSLVNWCDAKMEPQQELGVLAKRRNRNDSLDRSYPFSSRTNMILLLQ